MSGEAQTPAAHAQMIKAATRLLKVKQARDNLISFCEVTMPHPSDQDDPSLTRYDAQYFHKALAATLEEVEAGRLKRLIITFPPRHGKQFADSTPVLTPAGWTTHGSLKAGDYVYGSDGRPTRVVAVSGPSASTLEVEISDGTVLKTHPNHEWLLYSRNAPAGAVYETGTLAARKLVSPGIAGHKYGYYSLPLRPAIVIDEADLPIPPYVLGAWLGDGSSRQPYLAHAPEEHEVVQGMVADGYPVAAVYTNKRTGVKSTSFGQKMRDDLRAAGLWGNKHIPEAYKRASIAQRLELLAGLVDTDGTVVQSRGRVQIVTTNPGLAQDIVEIIQALGWPVGKYSSPGRGPSQAHFQICFQPSEAIPTRLLRKRVRKLSSKKRLHIKAVRPCEPEIGHCIQVAAADGLYLVGRGLIPTHNSELTSKRFLAWYIGRDPYKHIALGTYNQEFADDFGRAVRDIIQSPSYSQVFPDVSLKKNSAASDRMQTEVGGALYFVGRGGPITGRGADLIIIDDPIKNSEEADSSNIRNQLWEWFNNDIMSRFMTDQGQAIVIQTRWSEDDLVGRLTDPKNPCYVEEEAKQWKIINIPAIAEDDDVLGRKAGEPLWPSRFGLDYLLSFKRRNPRGFNALYQQRPTPDDGDFFKADYIKEYLPQDLPPLDKMRLYMASDHAVSQKQENDRTCIVVAGVDSNDNIWILDCYWRRAKTDEAVEKLIDMFQKYSPLRWWAEDDHITKSIGPFLKKRMRERKVYMAHSKVNAYADKQKKAQAIQGRMSMGMVLFPKTANWYQDARDEILKFPRARHDDFVDAISTLGRGLGVMVAPARAAAKDTGPRVGTFGWVKKASLETKKAERRRINMASY